MRNLLCFIALAILAEVCAGIPSRNEYSVGRVKRFINPWDFFNTKRDTNKKTKPIPTTQPPTTARVVTTTPIATTTPVANLTDMNKMPINIAEGLGKLKTRAEVEKFLGITQSMSQSIDAVKKTLPAVGQSAGSSDWITDPYCTPRPQLIEFHQPSLYHGIIYPYCGVALRCGGCCYVNFHHCVPKEVQNITYTVYFVPYPSVYSQSSLTHPSKRKIRKKRSDVPSLRQIIVENHSSCECQCKVTAKDCNPERQFYKESACQCKCKDAFNSAILKCSEPFRYDEDTCSCKCAYPNMHCPIVKQKWDSEQCKCVCDIRIQCPKGQVMNKDSCECRDQ